MTLFNCDRRIDCTTFGVIAALLLGVVAAFLQITGTVLATPLFLWAALLLGAVYPGVLLATVPGRRAGCKPCERSALKTVLTGILGTVLFAGLLLAVGIVATSILSAVLVGILVAFLTLIFMGTACLILCAADCDN